MDGLGEEIKAPKTAVNAPLLRRTQNFEGRSEGVDSVLNCLSLRTRSDLVKAVLL
jgi:hypothetical protein